MKKITVNSAAAANLVMLGAGYFTPLDGFMEKKDVIAVANRMQLDDGLFWPTPVVNLTNQELEITEGESIALIDPNVEGEQIIAIQTVNKIEKLSDDEIIQLDDAIEEMTKRGIIKEKRMTANTGEFAGLETLMQINDATGFPQIRPAIETEEYPETSKNVDSQRKETLGNYYYNNISYPV